MATTARPRRVTRKGCPNHPLEFKRRLAAAACHPDVSVARLALEHGVNTNLLFKWRRQYRKGKFGSPEPAHVLPPAMAAPAALPGRSESGITLLPVQVAQACEAPVATPPCIEVVFACATVRICGSPEASALRTVLDMLVRRA